MAFAVTRLPDKPVILVKLEVPLERYLSNFRAVRSGIERLVAGNTETFYILFDIQRLDISFSDILILLDELAHAPVNPRVLSHAQVLVIGTHPLIEIGVRRIQKLTGLSLNRCASLEEGLAWASKVSKSSSGGIEESNAGTR